MKLIVQIPAYNEEATIATVIDQIPRQLQGIERVEVLVIDDGSIDRTAVVAREAGADHVISLNHNRGLAFAFHAGIDACLRDELPPKPLDGWRADIERADNIAVRPALAGF